MPMLFILKRWADTFVGAGLLYGFYSGGLFLISIAAVKHLLCHGIFSFFWRNYYARLLV